MPLCRRVWRRSTGGTTKATEVVGADDPGALATSDATPGSATLDPVAWEDDAVAGAEDPEVPALAAGRDPPDADADESGDGTPVSGADAPAGGSDGDLGADSEPDPEVDRTGVRANDWLLLAPGASSSDVPKTVLDTEFSPDSCNTYSAEGLAAGLSSGLFRKSCPS
jgi:hypothetical protein